ncbi:MAG TPA: hypothetical protein VG838_11470 [Opitutaceae bacterium]|nr:hypothetical protein [Opitutaceae bacterium]
MQSNKILLSAVGVPVLAGLGLWLTRPQTVASATPSIPDARPSSVSSSRPPVAATAPAEALVAPPSQDASPAPSAPAAMAANAPAPEPKSPADEALEQAVNLLVSPQSTFLQRQAVWGQLRNSGQIPQVIAALEQRQAADPTSAEIPTALGMAYLINISTSSDVREQGIGGMKADMSFDAALKIDPNNWEAGFLKASALTHWPDSMKMGPQVIQRFSNLIELQESQPSQPQFVQSYVLLGDQYQKSGQADEARQAWSRGLVLFPGSQTLAQRLNPAP